MRTNSENVCTRSRKFITFNCCLLLLLALLSCQQAGAALVGYWNFDEGSGLTANDLSGDAPSHNGALQGGNETPAWVPGRLGTALGFTWQTANAPGSGRRVVVPYHTNLTLNGAFTISYWYRMDAATPSGTFPGIMRLGTSQSTTTGNNVGWGFFRTANMVYKRGNNQPGVFTAMTPGTWYHLALRFDGTTAANNNIAFINGVQIPFSASGGWSNVTTTAAFELGRMDAFDQATLDDLALWNNEAVAPAKIRSLYTVPTSLNLDYNLADMRTLWGIFDAAGASNATVKGAIWTYVNGLPLSPAIGDAYLAGPNMYLSLSATSGVTAALTTLAGRISPGGIGVAGTFTLAGSPIVATNANLVFDLRDQPVPGSGTNDYINITGDFSIANSTVTIDPITPLPGGTYRLVDYTGTKTGSLVLSNTSRYTLSLDDTTAGQINLTVSGTNGAVKWTSLSSSAWDLTSLNWTNLLTSTADRFFQGDSVVFDDSGAYQTAVTVAAPMFPRSITVNSSNRNYTFTGADQIGGAAEGIIKNGASILTLSTPNTFIGDVQVNAGTLKLGNAAALGTVDGQTIVAAGATLDLTGINPGTESVTVQGAGVGSAGAIVNTGAALSNTGLRGRVTLAGDTFFGGVNRWDVFGGSMFGGGYKLTKVGAPEIALSNLGDTGLGEIEVVQGTLTVLGNTGLGEQSKSLTVSNNAALAFWASGSTILDKPFVMRPSSILRNATSGNTDITTNVGAVSISGDVLVQATANIALLGPISGTGNLVKQNTGTLYLGGTSSYTGKTTISAGRLAMLSTGSINGSPRIELASGTTLDTSRVIGGYTLAPGQTLVGNGSIAGSLVVGTGSTVLPGVENIAATLAITNGLGLAGGTLVFDLTSVGTEGAGVNDLITVGGNLDLTAPTSVRVNPLGLLAIGNIYTLINYTGALNGDVSNLVLDNNTRYTLGVSFATAGKVLLTVIGGEAGDLGWIGGAPGRETIWDVQNTPNWSFLAGGAEALFFGGDRVTFDNFGYFETEGVADVDLVGILTPTSVRVDNGDPVSGGLNYTFRGSGKLSGNSTLTKRFDGKLTIANSNVNDYVGATVIEGGVLQVGSGGTVGNLGSGPITNDATLIYNRSDNISVGNTLAGTGSLIKENTNTMAITANNAAYSGSLTATGGIIRPTVANALGNAAGSTTIAPGATLDVNGINLADETVVAAGAGFNGVGAVINNGAGQNNALRYLTLAGNTTVGGSGRWDVRGAAGAPAALSSGGIAYSLTKIGANQVSVVDVSVDPALGDLNVNSGILSMELSSAAGDPNATVTVANNATLQFWGRTVPFVKKSVFNGGRNLLVGNGDSTLTGPVTINNTVLIENAGTSLTITDPITGPGSLVKTGAAIVTLIGDNLYSGATTNVAGTLQLGAGGTSGSVLGDIRNNATLAIFRSDAPNFANNVTGNGSIQVRTLGGMNVSSPTFNLGSGTLSVGINSYGVMTMQPGVTATMANLFLGDSSAVSGDMVQLGGDITVSAQMRVGHWPSPLASTYVMGGGTLRLTAIPAGVPNPAGVAEVGGILYLGIDGTGNFVQTGGVATVHGIVLDGRGNTTAGGSGIDTFILNGGRFVAGPSGIKSGSLDANTSIAIQLGGGTLASSANWTSVLAMTLTGTNGNTVFDSGNNSNVLTGPLTGSGGLTKIGSGTLALTGNDTFTGGTILNEGALLVRGSLGNGSSVVVNGGTLAGDGNITDAVTVNAGGIISPGPGIARLTINNGITLAGNTVMQIAKTGTDLTNDTVYGTAGVTFGGALTVTASGDALAAGNRFKLFNGTSYTGSFTTLTLPALPGSLSWDLSQLGVDGTLGVADLPPKLNIAASGNTLSLTWSNGTDFALQAQTNSVGVGIQTNTWVTVTNGANGSVTFQIDRTSGSVFYRLIKP